MATNDIKLSMLSNFRLRHAKLLLELEKHGNLSHAARALNMSQPAATKLLQTLEASLGVALFNRTNRGIEPTPYGLSLMRHCRPLISQLSHAADDLDELSKGNAGHVTIGTLLTGSALVLPTVIARIRRTHPGLTFKIRDGTIDMLLQALQDEEVDCIVGRLTIRPMREGIVQQPLFKGKVSIAAGAGHELSSRRRLRLRDLAACDWILPPPTTTLRTQIESAFRAEGLPPPRNLVESINFLTNRQLLISTDLIGVFPHPAIESDIRRGALVALPVSLPFSNDPYGIIHRKDMRPHPAAETLIAELRRFAKELDQAG